MCFKLLLCSSSDLNKPVSVNDSTLNNWKLLSAENIRGTSSRTSCKLLNRTFGKTGTRMTSQSLKTEVNYVFCWICNCKFLPKIKI